MLAITNGVSSNRFHLVVAPGILPKVLVFENGSTILRREKIFTDGSRLVEESYIDGSELEEGGGPAAGMSVPLVNASIYGNNIEGDNTNNATSARRKDGGDNEMLQPQYNADGWLPGVIMMMICRE